MQVTNKLQTFIRESENRKMKDSKKLERYFSRNRGVVKSNESVYWKNNWQQIGEKITDSRVLEKISISLSKIYESFIALIEELIGSLKSDRVKIVMILWKIDWMCANAISMWEQTTLVKDHQVVIKITKSQLEGV